MPSARRRPRPSCRPLRAGDLVGAGAIRRQVARDAARPPTASRDALRGTRACGPAGSPRRSPAGAQRHEVVEQAGRRRAGCGTGAWSPGPRTPPAVARTTSAGVDDEVVPGHRVVTTRSALPRAIPLPCGRLYPMHEDATFRIPVNRSERSMSLPLLGGVPVADAETYPSWPQWGDHEREELLATLDSGAWWTGDGERAYRFAGEFALLPGGRERPPVHERHADARGGARGLRCRRGRRGDRAGNDVRCECKCRPELSTRRP